MLPGKHFSFVITRWGNFLTGTSLYCEALEMLFQRTSVSLTRKDPIMCDLHDAISLQQLSLGQLMVFLCPCM